jgi:DeoD family purine-nucleoside phosphorylase
VSHIVRAISDGAAQPIHLNPSAALAERVLLPGDPHRALAVAQALTEDTRMFNTRRGLWGYTGRAPDGELVTVQATGMGGPSAAIVISELVDLGAKTLIRIGTCGGLDAGLELGDFIVAREAIAADGASRAMGAGGRVAADAAVSDALVRSTAGAREGAVVSTDLFYDPRADIEDSWRLDGALAVEMEAATLFAVAARHGVAAACLVAVSDVVATRERIGASELESAEAAMGRVALRALEARTAAG